MTDCLPASFKRDILPYCQTPLTGSLILHLTLLAPMSRKEIERIYTESLVKEMSVMESSFRRSEICYEAFFGDYNTPIHELVPANPTIAQFIHRGIDMWIANLTKVILYPKISSKTVSKLTAAEVLKIDPEYVSESNVGITAIDVERIYHQYGIKVKGPCEMRQKWYYSNLKPRTYYAQGGDAFHSSKHLSTAFVDLCDILPATNRRSRTDPSRISVDDPDSDVVYYDLSSFTSNLHEHRVFMNRLAKYCTGSYVRILDSVEGVLSVDLGDLIYEYTAVNLHHPSYTLPHKHCNSSLVHYHNIAGFLGVYGNIATATFIHGIVMAMKHESLDENNVAGDDGLDVTRCVQETLALVSTLGVVSDEKTFRSSEGCCIHLKRPIIRQGKRLYLGNMYAWPSLEPGQVDFDARYPYLRNLSNRERKDAIASSITAFLRKLETSVLEDSELDMVDTIISHLYDTYRLPREGCVPQITMVHSGFVPAYERRFIGMDPITNTIMRHYTHIARVPLRGFSRMEMDMLTDTTFMCNSSKLLKHLTVLGYLEQEKVTTFVYGEEGMDLLLKEYTCPEPPIYRYTIMRGLPVWATEIVSNS